MLKPLLLTTILLISILPTVSAATTSSSTSSAEHCTVYNLAKIVAVINAGTEEICIIFDTNTPIGTAPMVRMRASGPDNALGVAFTQTWSIIAGTVAGCTTGTLTQTNGASAATSWANAYFTITFNTGSRQCTGMAQYTLTAATVPILTWQGGWDTDLDSDAAYVFNCAYTGTTTNAQDPNSATCNLPANADYDFQCANTATTARTTDPGLSTCNQPLTSGALYSFQCGSTSTTVNAATPLGQSCNQPLSTVLNSQQGYSSDTATRTCSMPRNVIAGTIYALDGFVQGCIDTPGIVPAGSSFTVGYEVRQPPYVSTFTLLSQQSNFQGLTGCTATTPTFSYNPSAGNGQINTGADGSAASYLGYGTATLTMTGSVCTGSWRVTLASNPSSSGGVTGTTIQVDVPFVIQTGRSSSVTNSGTINTVMSGVLDVLDRLCANSATGTTCNAPTLNAALSGSINAALSGNVALSGTINTVMSGVLDVLDRLCGNGATGTTCNVPTLNAALSGSITATLSGSLNIHQDEACGATITCKTNTTSTVMIGANTQNISVTNAPGFWELFGPLLLAAAFVILLSFSGIWIAPGGSALGMAIFLMAFKQPYGFLVLLQAVAGISLAIFCLIAIGIRVLEKKKKKEHRRFFD